MIQKISFSSLSSLCAALALGITALLPLSTSAPLLLKYGDAVCLIGKALVDHNHQNGCVKSILQSQLAVKRGVSFVDLFTTSQAHQC